MSIHRPDPSVMSGRAYMAMDVTQAAFHVDLDDPVLSVSDDAIFGDLSAIPPPRRTWHDLPYEVPMTAMILSTCIRDRILILLSDRRSLVTAVMEAERDTSGNAVMRRCAQRGRTMLRSVIDELKDLYRSPSYIVRDAHEQYNALCEQFIPATAADAAPEPSSKRQRRAPTVV